MTPHSETPEPRTRVVVTGIGAITPLGNSVPATWRAMLAGVSGAAPITAFDASEYGTTFACEVHDFDPALLIDRKLANRLDRVCLFALWATDEALRDARLSREQTTEALRENIAVVFGTGVGGIQTFQEQTEALIRGGPKRLSPFFIPMMIPDMTSGIVSIQNGFRGPNHSVVSACATGNHSIADAAALIRGGHADIVVCGGTEAAVCEVGVGGFAAMKALSTRNDDPAAASRPFDGDRDGFVLGEGAGALILESAESARARGVPIYAEVLAMGASADAYHITAPHPDGLGARLAMTRALDEAGIAASAVDTINMHGTSTPLGDVAESRAIRDVFGAHADRLTATSTKSMTGHMLGAAGAVEAIASILSITDCVIPPTINHHTPDPACDLHYAFNVPERRIVRVAMSNAFGFGGHNTSAIFAAWDGDGERRASSSAQDENAEGGDERGTVPLDIPRAAW
jgi:3-oxoacyl-[acyl-carrier-protein] synthase II